MRLFRDRRSEPQESLSTLRATVTDDDARLACRGWPTVAACDLHPPGFLADFTLLTQRFSPRPASLARIRDDPGPPHRELSLASPKACPLHPHRIIGDCPPNIIIINEATRKIHYRLKEGLPPHQ